MEASSVIVEWRPLLQVCQFYIKSGFDQEETKITVLEQIVKISTQSLNLEIVMPDDVKLLEGSLSGLHFNVDSLLFRSQTVPPKNRGCFKAEFLTLNSPTSKSEFFKPNVEIDQETEIFCMFCSNCLSKKVKFSKILPLPENFDSSDFFCHGKLDVNLDPKEGDLLYSYYSFKIHPSSVTFDDKIEDVVLCGKCLSWLGNRDEKHLQLWNSTVYFGEKPSETALNDFVNSIKKASNEFLTNNKIVVVCDIGNKERHYLLLWIMDKCLNLLLSGEDILSEKVILKEKKVTKLLYSYQTSKTELVEKWSEMSNLNAIKVSKIMLQEGFEYLNKMSEFIPEEFRSSHNMNISFLDV